MEKRIPFGAWAERWGLAILFPQPAALPGVVVASASDRGRLFELWRSLKSWGESKPCARSPSNLKPRAKLFGSHGLEALRKRLPRQLKRRELAQKPAFWRRFLARPGGCGSPGPVRAHGCRPAPHADWRKPRFSRLFPPFSPREEAGAYYTAPGPAF